MQLEGSKLIGRTQVFNSVFSNTGQPCPTQPCFGGTSPEAGVDIEPNVPTDEEVFCERSGTVGSEVPVDPARANNDAGRTDGRGTAMGFVGAVAFPTVCVLISIMYVC